MAAGICECGCGGRTAIAAKTDRRTGAVQGKPRRFIKGHTGGTSPKPVGDRFWPKVDRGSADECWLWQGCRKNGYGSFRLEGNTKVGAHRLAYELMVGPIPDGLVIDHLCRTPACVNPSHLEPVTCGENTRRGVALERAIAYQRAKTHCPAGHPYSPENTRIDARGSRVCRTCSRANAQAHAERKATR